jgi:tetratricopeptide (TPR) repeat protein
VEDFDPMLPNEWQMIYIAATALVIFGLGLALIGLMAFKQGLAFGMILFLAPFLFHMLWRYKPLQVASHLLDEGRFEAAQSLLEHYRKQSFHRGGRAAHKALILLSQSLWYQGKPKKSLEVVDQLVEQAQSLELRVLTENLRVACYVQMRKPLKVHEVMSDLLRLDGITKKMRCESEIHVGVCAMNEELFHDAIEFFEAAKKKCESDGRRAYIHGMLSACFNRVKDYIRALGAVQDGKKLNPTDPLVRSLLLDNFAFAKANLKQDLQEALAAAEEGVALGLPAALPHLYTSRGEVHYALRDFDAAVKDLDLALGHLPERDKNARQKAWFIKGKIHKARGEDDLALQALSEAISIDSSKTIAMNAQAVLASPEGLNTLIQSGDVKLQPPS